MRVILFGASGMVGQGVLLECLDDPRVEAVLAVSRRPLGQQHLKLSELILADFDDYHAVESELTGFDACFFCLGVSSAGMREVDYSRVTHDITLAAANVLLSLNPRLKFVYVSGAGTDSGEKGRQMWARVKGRTENDLLAMPFIGAWMFRPGFIQPVRGVRSRTGWYQAMYTVFGPLFPLLERLTPALVTTTERVGRAMIAVVDSGFEAQLVETRDINDLAARSGAETMIGG